MHKMHLIALLQTGYTTVNVTFAADNSGQSYTYKAPTKMGVAVGDMPVVPARKAFAIVWVKSVDASPKINVEAPFEYKWVVQKVDMTAYVDQTERERQAAEAIEEAQRLKAQREALQALLGSAIAEPALLALINGIES
jgi:hypothetical protein